MAQYIFGNTEYILVDSAGYSVRKMLIYLYRNIINLELLR